MTTTPRTVNVRIRGRVQGVWYRGWTAERARALDLSGWVRNRRDGSVEAILSGAPPAVQAMIDQCWRGPVAAAVTEVIETDLDHHPDPGFQILPSA